jgi:hypothetical protein
MGAGWSGIMHNLDKLIRYTLWGWAFGIFPIVLHIQSLPYFFRQGWREWRTWFLMLWALPCLLFYTLIHMGQQGLIFVYLPILLLISASACNTLARRWHWGGVLIFAPSHLLPGQRLKVLNYATIVEHDMRIQAQIHAVQTGLPSSGILISQSWRYPQYYLPDVTLVPYEAIIDNDTTMLSEIKDATALAWYEPVIDNLNRSPDSRMYLVEYENVQLRVLQRTSNEQFYISPSGFGIIPDVR